MTGLLPAAPRVLASTVATCVALVTCIAVASPVAEASSGPCPDVNGVTVVVDFGTLGGGVQVRCAPGDPDSGYAALSGAGFSAEGTLRSPGFLCRIDGRPSASADPCVVPSPPWAYWSYWIADRGGSWCYSDTGLFGRNPPRGTVEGWVFVSGSGSSSVHAPRSSTFSRLAGAGTTGADCDKVTTATTVPATTTPQPPTTRPPANPSAPPRPSDSGPRVTTPGTPSGAATTPAAPSQPGATGGSSGAVGSVEAPAGAGEAGATTIPGSPTTTAAGGSAASAAGKTSGASEVGEEAKGDSEAESDRDGTEELASSVTLADSGRSGPGSALGTGVGVGMIAALGAAAVVVNRRRLQPPDGI